MKIILIQDVEKLGEKGELLEVKDGFARNYLIPHHFAVLATKGNMRTLENEKKGRERKEQRELDQAKQIASEISNKNLIIKAKAGEEGKLFGSVTAQDIADALAQQANIQIDKKKIELGEPVKRIGTYTVSVKLSRGLQTQINFEVAGE